MAYTTRIPDILNRLPAHLDAAVRAGVEAIANDAKTRAPVDTGRLRDSIHVERRGPSEYTVLVDAFYGQLVEFGSTSTGARPYLIPAIEANRERVIGEVRAEIRRLI